MKKITFTLIMACNFCWVTAQNSGENNKDAKFAAMAAEGGILEVKLGQLAQINGSTQEVKDLGKAMEQDHSKANEELKTLTTTKNIALPAMLSEKKQKKYDALAKKKGKEFDKAYTKCMVKDHKKDLCLFKKEARKGNDLQLQSWAKEKVPVLEHHLHMSKESCKAVKKSR